MAERIEWVRMLLKNHVAVIAIWLAIFGIGGYQAYRDMPTESEPLPIVEPKTTKTVIEKIVEPPHTHPHDHPDTQCRKLIAEHEKGKLH